MSASRLKGLGSGYVILDLPAELTAKWRRFACSPVEMDAGDLA
jgi:hypothetical protein